MTPDQKWATRRNYSKFRLTGAIGVIGTLQELTNAENKELSKCYIMLTKVKRNWDGNNNKSKTNYKKLRQKGEW
ncbi:MAG: hypothetical protein ACTSQA_00580 [Candidatus Heimdallarchaeaceae archaeon]